MKVYNQQLSKLQRNPKDKNDVTKPDAKLQKLGHLDYLTPVDIQNQLRNNDVQNFIPSLHVQYGRKTHSVLHIAWYLMHLKQQTLVLV